MGIERIRYFFVAATVIFMALVFGAVGVVESAEAKKFFKVPLARIVPYPYHSTPTIGGQLFNSVWNTKSAPYGSWRMVNHRKTSCKSVNLKAGSMTKGNQGYFRVQSVGKKTRYLDVPQGSVRNFGKISVKPRKSLRIDVRFHNGNSIWLATVYANGFAKCFTRNGKA